MVFGCDDVKQSGFFVMSNESMTRAALEHWLKAYGKAWESLDPAAAVALYANGATYQETPFVKPLRGRGELLRYWTHVAETQRSVQFDFEVFGAAEGVGFAQWWATFRRVPPDIHIELNGIFTLVLNDKGLCVSLREWWHRRELPRS